MTAPRFLSLLAALGLLAGCSSVESFVYHGNPVSNEGEVRNQVGQLPTNPAEKPIVQPVSSLDINCPDVAIVEGGSAFRVGGPDNASVRYQFNIANLARQCDPAGPGQATIKVGVAGNLVIGPAGSPGTFSVPVRITVTEDASHKQVFSKTYTVQAAADAMNSGQFRIVSDPIPVSMPTLQLVNIYSITVGFEGGGGGGAPRAHRRRTAG